MHSSFHQVRLSPRFTLLDFMHDRLCYASGVALDLSRLWDDRAIRAGETLARDLLEPLVDAYGPLSIASGWRPEPLIDRPDFQTPHRWGLEPPLGQSGAAADISVHSWVNAEMAPIAWVREAVREGFTFNRAITYAGSEFVCVSTSTRPRLTVYENQRVPGRKRPHFQTHARGQPGYNAFADKPLPGRENWRRTEGEGSYHHGGGLRAHHVRVGRNFTLLDFCRSEAAMAQGQCWVPPLQAAEQITRARMFAEVLDPLKQAAGHLTIVKGMVPRRIAASMIANGSYHRWTSDEREHRIEMLLPEGWGHRRAASYLDHREITNAHSWTTRAGTMLSLRINPFQPEHIWGDEMQPVAKELA